jgi:Undecaprenyl-phosphate galactose phosphotransferase WbaP
MGAAVQSKLVVRPRSTPKPLLMIALMVLSDVIALLVSVSSSICVKAVVSPPVELTAYLRLFPFLFVFVGFYAAVGLYSSGVSFGPPEEIRRATLSSAVLFLTLAAVTVYWRGASQLFTWTLFLAMLLSAMLVPLTRGVFRLWSCEKDWWGYPTVILGANETGKMVLRAIREQPGLGLKPVAFVDPASSEHELLGVPVLAGLDSIRGVVNRAGHAYAIVAMPDQMSKELIRFIEREVVPQVAHLLVIPSLFEWSSFWVRPKSLGNMLGLEIPQATSSNHEIPKRLLDVLVSGTLLLLLVPLFVFVAIAIKLTSRGPVLFGHRRIGLSGEYFKAWKFRTMVDKPDAILERHLLECPEAREEWARDQKLRKDPRVTKVGRFLRKTSMDELPQLWNVLKNEMSLVGPRPIVQAEIERYGAAFDLYTRVKGGLTGLWQVSGRNDTTYEERVRLDTMYVRNWSVWLDLFILCRTIGVVLFRGGAY